MKTLERHQLDNIMSTFVDECNALYGNKLCDVRLFGSYARGDCNDDSDIDILIILDMEDSEARKSLDGVCHIASELDLKHNVVVSPVICSKREYDLRKQSYGFYGNVEKEGVSMHLSGFCDFAQNDGGRMRY